jgi:hypothetical protein
MNTNSLVSIIRQDISSIFKILEGIRDEQIKNVSFLSESSIADPILPFHYSLNALSLALEEFTKSPNSQQALKLLNLLLVVSAQPDAITARFGTVTTAIGIPQSVKQAASCISTAWNSFTQSIKSVIQSISSALWSLVSNYINLKEWSVKGAVSTPAIVSLFGISGSVEIQLTFEK